MGMGSSWDLLVTVIFSASSSIEPVFSLGFMSFSGLALTRPVISTTSSGLSLGKSWPTIWILPVRSLRSRKVILPWSRIESTQPLSLTVWPTRFGVSFIMVLVMGYIVI